jgi:ABC-2 type transport system permease protein
MTATARPTPTPTTDRRLDRTRPDRAGSAGPTRSGGAARPAGLARLGGHQIGLELRQFSRSREQVVFTLLFPVIMMVIFGSIFDAEIGAGVTYTQYFVSGMVAAGLMVTGFQALAIQIPIERDRGVLKRYRATPMPRSAYFIGKVGMVVTLAVAQVVLLLAIAVPFFDVSLPSTADRWFTLVWVIALGTTACTLTGIAFSSLPRTSRSATAIVTPVALVLQFISGVFFIITELPSWMQQVAALFPLKWMCQGMRAVFLPDAFGAQEPAGGYELGRVAIVLAAWCVLGLVLCLLTFRWTRRQDG